MITILIELNIKTNFKL